MTHPYSKTPLTEPPAFRHQALAMSPDIHDIRSDAVRVLRTHKRSTTKGGRRVGGKEAKLFDQGVTYAERVRERRVCRPG